MYPVRTPFAERDTHRLRYTSPDLSTNYTPRRRQYTPSPSRTKHLSLRIKIQSYARRYYGLLILVALVFAIWTLFGHEDEQLQVVGSQLRQSFGQAGVSKHFSSQKRHRSWPGWKGIEQVYAFGDSHTDTGFRPGGVQPNHFNPLGNPYWPGRTANYGPNYLGHLTATFNGTFIKTFNLAKKNSVVFRREGVDSKVLTLEHQVEDIFVERYGRSHTQSHLHKNSGWRQDNTLFVFHAGTDDIVQEWINRVGEPGLRNLTMVDMFFAEYRSNLNRIYDYGARNFIIVGFPALEESPRLRLCGKENSQLHFGAELLDMNSRLAFMTHVFAESHLDATVFFFDNYQLSNNVRGWPQKYHETREVSRLEGFCYPYAMARDVINTNDQACGDPLEHFYWRDEEHQTESYHRLQARLMVQEMSDLRNTLPYEFY